MADDDFNPVAPKMSGLFQHVKDKYVAWTGGKPKRDWTGLDDSAPMHNGQL